MTDRTTHDGRPDAQNGAHERWQNGFAKSSKTSADGHRLSGRDGGLADADQTRSDSDQTAADNDQTAADNDQAAADSDQAASDRDFGRGGDATVHDSSREARDRTAQQRHASAQGRVDAAHARDEAAYARDVTASSRDHIADLHDRALAERDAAQAETGTSLKIEEIARRAVENRRSAADARVAAAEGRVRAAADRLQASRDREQSARDRAQARVDQEKLADQLAIAETDQLTRARTRSAGLIDLEHEIDRARRTTAQLAVAYVDVVGLKAVNDARGHAAGDALLQRAAHAIQAHLRSYDLIIRLGGDEFLCVMSGATIEDARERFNLIEASLAVGADRCEIKVGFAALAAGDSVAELIKRADAELPTSVRP